MKRKSKAPKLSEYADQEVTIRGFSARINSNLLDALDIALDRAKMSKAGFLRSSIRRLCDETGVKIQEG